MFFRYLKPIAQTGPRQRPAPRIRRRSSSQSRRQPVDCLVVAVKRTLTINPMNSEDLEQSDLSNDRLSEATGSADVGTDHALQLNRVCEKRIGIGAQFIDPRF